MKASSLIAVVMALLFAAAAYAEHDCDAPVQQQAIHDEHGNGHCGNSANPQEYKAGQAENCTDATYSPNGTLLRGEWLTCGAGDGLGGADGCSYIIIALCGGTRRSHEILQGRGSSGELPTCGYDAGQYYCQTGDDDIVCSCSGTTLVCG